MKKKPERLTLTDFRNCYKIAEVKISGKTNRSMEWNRITHGTEDQVQNETSTYTFNWLLTKAPVPNTKNHFDKWCWNNWITLRGKKFTLNTLSSHHIQKLI